MHSLVTLKNSPTRKCKPIRSSKKFLVYSTEYTTKSRFQCSQMAEAAIELLPSSWRKFSHLSLLRALTEISISNTKMGNQLFIVPPPWLEKIWNIDDLKSLKLRLKCSISVRSNNEEFQDISRTIANSKQNSRTFQDIPGQMAKFQDFQDFQDVWPL